MAALGGDNLGGDREPIAVYVCECEWTTLAGPGAERRLTNNVKCAP